MDAQRIRHAARALPLWALALLAAAALAGCYTMLRHPASGDLAAGDATDECLRCHESDASLEIETYPWVEYYSYSASPWINYYGAPWWHDVRWERCETCDGTEASTEDPDFVLTGRNGWGRRVRQAGGESAAGRERNDAFAPLPIVSPPAVAPVVARPVSPPAVTPPTGTPAGDQPAEDPEPEKTEPPRQRGIRR